MAESTWGDGAFATPTRCGDGNFFVEMAKLLDEACCEFLMFKAKFVIFEAYGAR